VLLAVVVAVIVPKVFYFRWMFSTPSRIVELQPPAKLADSMVEGKLELAVHDEVREPHGGLQFHASRGG